MFIQNLEKKYGVSIKAYPDVEGINYLIKNGTKAFLIFERAGFKIAESLWEHYMERIVNYEKNN